MSYTFRCVSRSSFLTPITNALRQQQQNLVKGQPVTVQLMDQKGYKGKYICEIDTSRGLITVNYDYSDASWFPARIKAACIALCLEGFHGTFEVSHDNGYIVIKPI